MVVGHGHSNSLKYGSIYFAARRRSPIQAIDEEGCVYARRTYSQERSQLKYLPLNYGDFICSSRNIVSSLTVKFDWVANPKVNSQEE
jgi:hypothetical protein